MRALRRAGRIVRQVTSAAMSRMFSGMSRNCPASDARREVVRFSEDQAALDVRSFSLAGYCQGPRGRDVSPLRTALFCFSGPELSGPHLAASCSWQHPTRTGFRRRLSFVLTKEHWSRFGSTDAQLTRLVADLQAGGSWAETAPRSASELISGRVKP